MAAKKRNTPRNITDMTHYNIMQSCNLKNLPDLDVCVLGALELFHKEKLPNVKISYKRPMVVGSGNAEATGRIMFHDKDAVFANESNVEEKLKNITHIDGVVLISASGAKHAPIIAKLAKKKYKKKVTLITNTPDAHAAEFSDTVYVFPDQKEPYTYNTSTYMGMILGNTGEDPKKIYDFITQKVCCLPYPDFSAYDHYFLILPNKYGTGLKRMFEVKFIELFGRKLSRDIETVDYMKHAVTVVPSNDLFISFGEKNVYWGKKKNRLCIPLPKWASYGTMMAIGYYVIGQIQKQHPPWFKKNIKRYTTKISKVFNHTISPIVE